MVTISGAVNYAKVCFGQKSERHDIVKEVVSGLDSVANVEGVKTNDLYKEAN
jgi:hypothetical protein